MKKIQLWSILTDTSGPSAKIVDSLENTETEVLLEDLLAKSPQLLGDDLMLVGRQVPTDGGPLDLLGVDEDGRLVVFELKRGMLTREAVAQVLDYASDLAESDPERIARLVQDYSGRLGIEKIEDFEDWYAERFPNSPGVLAEAPKMVLVGLGVDGRARRVVNYLADAGVQIELLTFHAFQSAGQMLLARQVESTPPRPPTGTKQRNLQALHQLAGEHGVLDLLEEVASFIADNFPAYQWPGKTAYSFGLPERTVEGNPTARTYVRLDVNQKQQGVLTFVLYKKALEAAAEEAETFRSTFAQWAVFSSKYERLEVSLDRESWLKTRTELQALLGAVARGVKSKASPEQAGQTEIAAPRT
jgi:hypothetical protein